MSPTFASEPAVTVSSIRDEAFGQRRHRRRVEQFRRVRELDVDRTRGAGFLGVLGEDHLQVELGGAGLEGLDLHVEPGQLEPRVRESLQHQHHLEQR